MRLWQQAMTARGTRRSAGASGRTAEENKTREESWEENGDRGLPATWLRAAQRGDDEAFMRLMRHMRDRLYRIAYAHFRQEADALDALQETAYRAYRSIGSCRSPEYVATWLVRILLNVCSDERKRGQKRRGGEKDLGQAAAAAAPPADAHIGLRAAVAELPTELKQIVILKYFEDMTVAEIARLLDCPEGTAKTRLHKALGELRRMYGEELGGDRDA